MWQWLLRWFVRSLGGGDMKSPFTGEEMTIARLWRTLSFRKEKFKILCHYYKCRDTGEQFEDDLFADLNFYQVINQYKVKHNIPSTEQGIDE